MAIESKNLLVSIKSFSRSNPLPLDASFVWDDKSSADLYATQANAYGGQIVTALVGDKYKAYILQPSEAGYTLEPVGVDASVVKQYVIIGTRPEAGQEQGIIYIDQDIGYIWNGSQWVEIFQDFSSEIADYKTRIEFLETEIELKAPLDNPAFIGSVTIDGKDAATQEWVNSLIGQLNNGVPSILDTNNPLPSTDYKAGKTYRVAEGGIYAGQNCEVGDLIICIKDYVTQTASDSDFMVVQANIDGAVTGAESSTDGHIVVFDGVTGKVIKDGNIAIASLNDAILKSHEHINKTVLDSYTKTQEDLLSESATTAQEKVDNLSSLVNEQLNLKANSEDVYTTTVIDDKLKTITDNLNSKVDATIVDTKISEAKTEILSDAETAASTVLEERIGGIPETTTIKSYVDTAIGSGGTASAEAIATAKQEAIDTANAYTDSQLTIVEF